MQRTAVGRLQLEWVVCVQNHRPGLWSGFLGLHSIQGVQRRVGICLEGLKMLLLALLSQESRSWPVSYKKLSHLPGDR